MAQTKSMVGRFYGLSCGGLRDVRFAVEREEALESQTTEVKTAEDRK